MDRERIKAALADITADTDQTLRTAKLASLCSALFRENGVQLVVVGGSAIELLTDGAYTSGDIDFCLSRPATLELRKRQELMGQLGAQGGPRSWQVGGMFVDLLGPLETLARTPLRELEGPYGLIQIVQPEELLVERVLVSVYPGEYPPARECAKMLAGVALEHKLKLDWSEVQRLADLPDYRILPQCEALVREVANESSKPEVPSIPLDKPISWEDWLRGRRARRELSKRVAPGIIRRPSSSKDRRLRKLFNGERGLPFTPTEKL